MSNLSLFNELPVNAKFRFETPDSGKVFVKTSETGAHHDGAYQKVNPGVLVFPIPAKIVKIITVEFTTDIGQVKAVPLPSGRWFITYEYGVSNQLPTVFNTLEDVINHLGA